MKGCYLCEAGGRFSYVFGRGRTEEIARRIDVCPEIICRENLEKNKDFLSEVEVAFSAWDTPTFTEDEVRTYFPNLKILFYGAASVRYFAEPFMNAGVRVLSSWRIMAVPVAQFTVAQIVLANKGALRTLKMYKEQSYGIARDLPDKQYPGSYKTKVGILGAGAIGSLVIKMLKDYNVDVMVYDPFLSDERAAELGVEKYSLEEVFSECQTISNHIANNPQTVGMLDYSLFSRMGENATFINTGRGAQVVEADLIRALKEKPDRSAILDVTYPEPVKRDSEFLSMDNVFLFPHMAGYARDEVLMFSDFMIKQLDHYINNEEFDNCEVTKEMLATMA